MINKETSEKEVPYPTKENQVKIKESLTQEIRENIKEQGLEYIGEVEQEDTYYVEEGDKLEDKNLRVRKSGGEIMITVKETKEKKPVLKRKKVSFGPIESETEVEKKKNKYSTHQEVAVVRKKRKIFKSPGEKNQPEIQVNVDDVKGLGQFIEVKIDKNLPSSQDILNSMVDNLGLNRKNEEKRTYAQLSIYSSPPPAHALTENLMELFDELAVKLREISSGITKTTVITLAFIISLGFSVASSKIILASILVISISGAISDTVGVYTQKKLDYFTNEEEIRRSSLLNFLIRAGIPLVYIPLFITLPLPGAVLASLVLSLGLLFFVSLLVAAVEKKSYGKSLALHMALFVGVSLLSYGVSELIEIFLASPAGL